MIDTTLNEPGSLHGSAVINLATFFSGYSFAVEGNSWIGVLRYGEGRFSELTQAQALDDGGDTYMAAAQADTSGPIVDNPTTPSYIFIDGTEGP